MAKVLSPIFEDCYEETSILDVARSMHRSDLSKKGFRYYACGIESLPKERIESSRGAAATGLSYRNGCNDNWFLTKDGVARHRKETAFEKQNSEANKSSAMLTARINILGRCS